mmetsp:Transcript_78817/g.148717  ORF Transcript_78817/g.148717 Transcript_78817/m.148717 type:complete len:138 (+) Transcript_78817:69-482(+)
MRVLAIALACLVCVGQGRRMQPTSQGPAPGLMRQVQFKGQRGVPASQAALAGLLRLQGGGMKNGYIAFCEKVEADEFLKSIFTVLALVHTTHTIHKNAKKGIDWEGPLEPILLALYSWMKQIMAFLKESKAVLKMIK